MQSYIVKKGETLSKLAAQHKLDSKAFETYVRNNCSEAFNKRGQLLQGGKIYIPTSTELDSYLKEQQTPTTDFNKLNSSSNDSTVEGITKEIGKILADITENASNENFAIFLRRYQYNKNSQKTIIDFFFPKDKIYLFKKLNDIYQKEYPNQIEITNDHENKNYSRVFLYPELIDKILLDLESLKANPPVEIKENKDNIPFDLKMFFEIVRISYNGLDFKEWMSNHTPNNKIEGTNVKLNSLKSIDTNSIETMKAFVKHYESLGVKNSNPDPNGIPIIEIPKEAYAQILSDLN